MRRWGLGWYVLALFATAAVAQFGDADPIVTGPPKSGDIAGLVVAPDGQPVAGAKVWLAPQAGRAEHLPETVTGTDGRFRFGPDERPAPSFLGYACLVLADGYGLAAVSTMDRASLERIVLAAPAAWSASLADADAAPRAGLPMRASRILPTQTTQMAYTSIDLPALPGAAWQAVTNEDGVARFGCFSAGSRVSLECDEPTVARMDSTMLTVGLEPARLIVEPAGALQGQVVHADGTPAAGAFVVWRHDEARRGHRDHATADADGRFALTQLRPGHGILVAAPGPEDTAACSSLADPDVTVTPGAPVVRDLALPPGVALTVTVVDAETGQPVPQAAVKCYGPQLPNDGLEVYGWYPNVDAAGRVVLRVLPGAQRLRVVVPAATQRYDDANPPEVVVAAGQPQSVTVKVQARLGRTAFRGTVTDAHGQPVAGAQVTVYPHVRNEGPRQYTYQPESATTGADGRFTVASSGAIKATAFARLDHAATDAGVELTPGVESTLALADRALGSLTVLVTDPQEQPLPEAEVLVYVQIATMGMQIARLQTGPDGRVTFACPPHPSYSVEASHQGFGHAGRGKTPVGSGEHADAGTLVLPIADQAVAGWVLDEQERPVAGVNVSILGGANGFRRVTADAQGEWRIEGLVNAPVELVAATNDGRYYGKVTAEPGDPNVVIHVKERQPR